MYSSSKVSFAEGDTRTVTITVPAILAQFQIPHEKLNKSGFFRSHRSFTEADGTPAAATKVTVNPPAPSEFVPALLYLTHGKNPLETQTPSSPDLWMGIFSNAKYLLIDDLIMLCCANFHKNFPTMRNVLTLKNFNPNNVSIEDLTQILAPVDNVLARLHIVLFWSCDGEKPHDELTTMLTTKPLPPPSFGSLRALRSKYTIFDTVCPMEVVFAASEKLEASREYEPTPPSRTSRRPPRARQSRSHNLGRTPICYLSDSDDDVPATSALALADSLWESCLDNKLVERTADMI
ncbi:hypothetical protein HK097_003562 [Rhizophlyctis rosea]|uniref:BTB domain-containing protein n=1 Tax=Rhizophlyctis rosea TaxID=64517 RepID=A0AAD5SFF6_9FUNG|nr:hypothetical protein HK097_003562 [Rhizophlyctis rosea]